MSAARSLLGRSQREAESLFTEDITMGAWGASVFASDDAFDLMKQLCDENDLNGILQILCDVANTSDPERDIDFLAERAIIAAEFLVAAGGLPSAELPTLASSWFTKNDVSIDRRFVECALRALPRIESHYKELNTYWITSDKMTDVSVEHQNTFVLRMESINDLIGKVFLIFGQGQTS